MHFQLYMGYILTKYKMTTADQLMRRSPLFYNMFKAFIHNPLQQPNNVVFSCQSFNNVYNNIFAIWSDRFSNFFVEILFFVHRKTMSRYKLRKFTRQLPMLEYLGQQLYLCFLIVTKCLYQHYSWVRIRKTNVISDMQGNVFRL